MIDDPTNALHVARARVRVDEHDLVAADLCDLIRDSHRQLRELGEMRAIALAHVDQLEAGYRDHIGMAR